MNDFHSITDFILKEGTALAVLFFLVAFLVGMLQQSIGQKLGDALRKTSLEMGAVAAAVAGAVTPFCSCSTVPVLSGMLRSKVRFGVCFTFLVASPVINEGVLIVLMREKSMAQATLFLVLASSLSVAFGILLDKIGMVRFVRATAGGPSIDGAVDLGGSSSSVSFGTKMRFAARGAWHELKSASPYLIVGILVGSLIYGYTPQDALLNLQKSVPGPLLIFAMALIGVPFYLNAAMVVPIAIALLGKGLGVGAVAAFMVASTGTGIPEMIMLTKLFRLPLMLTHVLTIIVSATVIGVVMEFASKFF
ncbi:MAG: permease [Burkholderiales bacterium]|nr:permease [Burkholderiales bacterium]